MKKRRRTNEAGFTLLEVMVAIGILAVSLVAIFNVQASSILAASKVKFVTAATLLARSKMVDIEQELMEEGFSEFAESIEGDFSEEGWPDFRYSAIISKVEMPVPGAIPGQEDNVYASMMQGYSSMITDLISNSLRECIVHVYWGEGDDTEEVTLSTHFIELGRAQMLETTIGGPSGVGDVNNQGTNTNSNTNNNTKNPNSGNRFNPSGSPMNKVFTK